MNISIIGIIISIISLVISILTLILSFSQAIYKNFVINNVEVKELNDSFDLLFNDNDIFSVEIVNYNNRDMLIYLKEGNIDINGPKHLVEPSYYTIKANSVTRVEIRILSETFDSPINNKLFLHFQYKGLLFKRNIKYSR